jgi:hypothetical protein
MFTEEENSRRMLHRNILKPATGKQGKFTDVTPYSLVEVYKG